jgi:hypothetical protein
LLITLTLQELRQQELPWVRQALHVLEVRQVLEPQALELQELHQALASPP